MAGMVLVLAGSGCSQQAPNRAERMSHGYIYYLDGAGGGGALSNWSGGLKRGLLNAGYAGSGEVFTWNTGLGVVADQDATVDYKRGKAAECARRIQEYTGQHPGAPVTLVGLSAGTAVTVFVLEALPDSCQVENVILCGASISSDYNLTRALQRIGNRMYVYTSEKDAVLAFLVPMAGTADRRVGTVPSAGLRGFTMPARASAETRNQYAKVTHIGWKPEYARYGDFGGHTDALKAPFVQRYMAPLIMDSMAKNTEAAPTSSTVPNPDYQRWASFQPGSSVTIEGYQVIDGVKQPVRMTASLVSRHEDRLVVERRFEAPDGGNGLPAQVQQFIVEARIDPSEHPLTSPAAKIAELPAQNITVSGRKVPCRMRSVVASGEFPEYGRNVSATVGQSDAVPGGIAVIWLKSTKGEQPYEFRGQIVGYRTR